MKKIHQINTLFETRGGVLTTQELNEAGVSYYFIQKLLSNGQIERIKQGVYRLAGGLQNEWIEVSKIVPQGIYCLFSAALLHELSTFVPSESHLAIPWKHKITLPHYPPIRLYYWKDNQYKLGQFKYKKDAAEFLVYDLEKTVCDFIKLRKKVGLDITKEVIRKYLDRKDRNLNKITEYSRQLNISSVVEQYFKIMV